MAKFFPTTPAEFLAELERRAPEPRPGADTPDRQVMFDAGRRALALEMRDFFNQSQKLNDGVPR